MPPYRYDGHAWFPFWPRYLIHRLISVVTFSISAIAHLSLRRPLTGYSRITMHFSHTQPRSFSLGIMKYSRRSTSYQILMTRLR